MFKRISFILAILLLLIPAASAYDKTFYEGNKTLVIQQSITGKTLFTIQQVYALQGSDSRGQFFEEAFNITSYLASDYTFSTSDIGFSWKQFKGNNNITNTDFFLFKPSNYSVLVNDYGINSTWTSKEVYNNVTGLNDTIWYWNNQTVIIGNHTEIRDNSTWLKLNNLNGEVIKSGKSYVVKVVFTKNFEKEFSIQTIPSFVGVSDDRMTWWNVSYFKTPLLVNNTGNASILTNFQVLVNVTYNSAYMDANFTSFHLVNGTSNTEMVGKFWIDRNSSVNGSYANMWLNLSTIPASAWDNTTYSLYHRDVTEVDASNGTNTFRYFNNTVKATSGNDMWLDIPFNIYNAGYTARYSYTPSSGDGIHIVPNAGEALRGSSVYAADSGGLVRYYDTGFHDIGTTTGTPPYIIEVSPNADNYKIAVYNGDGSYNSGVASATYRTSTPTEMHYVWAGSIAATKYFLVRKSASPEPNALLGAEEPLLPPAILSNTICANWNTAVDVTTYYNTNNVQTNTSVTTSCFTNSTMMTAATNITMTGTTGAGTASHTWLWTQVSAGVQKIQVIISG